MKYFYAQVILIAGSCIQRNSLFEMKESYISINISLRICKDIWQPVHISFMQTSCSCSYRSVRSTAKSIRIPLNVLLEQVCISCNEHKAVRHRLLNIGFHFCYALCCWSTAWISIYLRMNNANSFICWMLFNNALPEMIAYCAIQ